jgi:hypothetical protein
VIIFYDWNEDQKTTNARKEWLDNKLKKLVDMLNKANAYFPENEKTNYLFIIGNQINKDQLLCLIEWQVNSTVMFKNLVFERNCK